MSADGPQQRRSGWAHFASLACAFVALMAWTWGTWPDAIVDFGRELYVPWRMSEGALLHRELAWFNGPLSPNFNALLFELFGVGLWTLLWANAALFAGSLALLHFVLRRATSSGAATVACIVAIATCGFGQQVGIGNYNQLAPYSHEATHGLLLALASLALLTAWSGRGSILLVLAAGFTTGLAFLTKPETFVAALAGSLVALVLASWNARFRSVRALVAFALGALTAVLLAWSLQIPAHGSAAAWRSTLGAWPQLASSSVSELKFYRDGMGIDAPLANIGWMLAWALGALALLGLGIGVGTLVARKAGERAGAGACALASAIALGLLWTMLPWSQAARPWPLVALATLVSATWSTLRQRGADRRPVLAGFAALSLALLAKMLLNARLEQYGFTLALPATALVAALLWSNLPALLARRKLSPGVARAAGAMLLVALVFASLAATRRYHQRKLFSLGTGPDEFRTDARGQVLDATLQWLERARTASTSAPTLIALPEGVMVNYLARLENPTPYINFMPPELVLFGEETILAALRATPPDIVLLTHKDTAEYGFPWFGRDYGRALVRWVMENYEPAALIGDPPLGLVLPGEPPLARAPVFGVRIFVRKRR
ncbi:MAG: hypothetical protein FJ294_11135 [Planctomycetes bacterium]|nr:hypothetical protein [Planctomycetota bacterium]